jgi:hypothetical protein
MMAEQTEEISFAAQIATLFPPEDADVAAYTMTLRCVECKEAMVALMPKPSGGPPMFGCLQCTRSVEVLFT